MLEVLALSTLDLGRSQHEGPSRCDYKAKRALKAVRMCLGLLELKSDLDTISLVELKRAYRAVLGRIVT